MLSCRDMELWRIDFASGRACVVRASPADWNGGRWGLTPGPKLAKGTTHSGGQPTLRGMLRECHGDL